MNGTLGFAVLFIDDLSKKWGDKKALAIGTSTFLVYIGC
jgi:hypothetical protein